MGGDHDSVTSTPGPQQGCSSISKAVQRSKREIKTLPLPALSPLRIKAHQISFLSCMWSRCQTGRLLSAFLRGSHRSAGPPGSLGRAWAEATHSWSQGWGGILSPTGCKMPGPLLVYNLPELPRAGSITSTPPAWRRREAFQVTPWLFLITHVALTRTNYALGFSTLSSLFLVPLQLPSSRKSPAACQPHSLLFCAFRS